MSPADKLSSAWERQLSSFPLDDLSSAYNLVGGFAVAVEAFCSAVRDHEYDTPQKPVDADAIIDLAYGLEEAADEAEHDVTEMVGLGWADEGYGDRVQERLEEITDALADALANFRADLQEARNA